MTTTYNWQIANMDCYPQAEGKANVVCRVNWLCEATNGAYSASSYGADNVKYIAGTPFTPYADLTLDQVLGWVWGSAYKDAVESSLNNRIAAQIDPPVVTPKLPWAA